ncbi:unnamed protein product [Gulo gulo]|uniref:Uncharacterized protein n=1 Tax=Gulo gulo TaxID=48420 RepID=A0A9X9LCE1_GULGU|nr:unnamed protein product [Gulo gulo]
MRNYIPLPVRTLSRMRRRRRNTTPGRARGHAASAVGETTFPRSCRPAAVEPIRFGIGGVGTSRPAAGHGFLGRIRRSPVGSRQSLSLPQVAAGPRLAGAPRCLGTSRHTAEPRKGAWK